MEVDAAEIDYSSSFSSSSSSSSSSFSSEERWRKFGCLKAETDTNRNQGSRDGGGEGICNKRHVSHHHISHFLPASIKKNREKLDTKEVWTTSYPMKKKQKTTS